MKTIKYEILYGPKNLSRPDYLASLGVEYVGVPDVRTAITASVEYLIKSLKNCGIEPCKVNVISSRDATDDEILAQESQAAYFARYGTACE